MTDGRKHLSRALATLCITAVSGSVLIAPTAHAAPDIDTARAQVDRLRQQADQASQRYDAAGLDRTRAHQRLVTLRRDLDHQRAKVTGIRDRVATSAARHSVDGDPEALVEQLSLVAAFNDQQRHVTTTLNLATRRLHRQQAAVRHQLVETRSSYRRLAADKTRTDADAEQAERLLGTLQARAEARAEARASRAEARASRSADRVAAAGSDRVAVAASGRAATAVRFALAQVGKSYVYGAAGPSAYDCSGLTMTAWGQAGVGLPHSSRAQLGSGTPVSQSDLQPGDLVFYYSPVSHVGIYIGNGQIVNALNPGAGVRVSAVNSMPYAGAVRPG